VSFIDKKKTNESIEYMT